MMSLSPPFLNPVSEYIWRNKYKFAGQDDTEADCSIDDSWKRVAKALSSVEPHDDEHWAENFYEILNGFKFLPGGRILAGAGTRRNVTLFNCFVMGDIEDSIDGIFQALREGAITMQKGGGVGYDFSSLRPAGTPVHSVGSVASGPVSFMHVWNSMCSTLLSTGQRRGAMMATLRCDHPDIEEFVHAKFEGNVLTHFNLSVLITDEFMHAVKEDYEWPLVFPAETDASNPPNTEIVLRDFYGQGKLTRCKIHKKISAKALWQKIARASYEFSEPGILFIDRINQENNLGYCEVVHATNPCGEIPLPAYGACNLGSINLPMFVCEPFTDKARMDFEAIKNTTAIAVRMLDNVIDVSRYPLKQQQLMAQKSRRIGLGVTGLADALAMLGYKYGDKESLEFVKKTMQVIRDHAYRTSVRLAKEKESFPLFDTRQFLSRPFVKRLPEKIKSRIEQSGMRNSHLLAVAPAGTISLLANNVSSGIEPIYALQQKRKIRGEYGQFIEFEIQDYAFQVFKAAGKIASFFNIEDLSRRPSVNEHLEMQAAIQFYVDNAISKTINLPENSRLIDCDKVFFQAYELGLKGCTIYRPSSVRGQVLRSSHPASFARCCIAD